MYCNNICLDKNIFLWISEVFKLSNPIWTSKVKLQIWGEYFKSCIFCNCLYNLWTGFPLCDSDCKSGSSSWEYHHCPVPISPQSQPRGAQSCMLQSLSVLSTIWNKPHPISLTLPEWETASVIMSLPVILLSHISLCFLDSF